MEKELFLTVANYPLLGNIGKYLATLNTMKLNESKPWLGRAEITFIIGGIESLPGGAKSFSFEEQDVLAFENKRRILRETLEDMVIGKALEESRSIIDYIRIADEFEMSEKSILTSTAGGQTKIKKMLMAERTLRGKTPESRILENLFNFICYSFISFLRDDLHGGRDRIRKCTHARCTHFFSRARNDERNRFCSDGCRKTHNQDQRKTDDGKAQRAAYMRRRRGVLSERRQVKKRAEKLKRLMDRGYTRKQAEKFLNDIDA